MKNIKIYPVCLLLLFVGMALGQQSNEFLSRAYWKTNPSIADIDQKIANGNDIAQLDRNMFDAVSMAIIEKTDNKTIKYLLSKKGNDVNKLTHDGRTYLFWAIYRDNLEIMRFLVEKGAKTDLIDSHGYSLANFAAVTGQLHTELYNFCLIHGADFTKEVNNDGANALLLVAPFAKNYSIIEYFISKGISLKSTDTNGNGIFNYAAKAGNIPLMKRLIDNGIDYKSVSTKGENAIIFASRGLRRKTNTLETFKYLASLGIPPNITTTDGETPLHALSYKSQDLETFKYFVDNGVNVNQANADGNTPLLYAASRNEEAIVRYLTSQTKNINHQNKEGKSALSNAVYRNTPEVVAFLLEKGANINVVDKEQNNLGYYLLKNYNAKKPENFHKKLALLQRKGFNFKKPQPNGNTLFHIAVDTENIDLIKYVQSLGIDVNQQNNDGISPLHIAAMKAKNTKVLKYLLSIGADKSTKTAFEESVYDLALENEVLQQENIDITFLK
ncbi:ankyrin repeat domain-containing protein [uncultured Kordia sp.]|uniref:ankyrin repeat domain-containing protein n=1 Tax=uncultured Kordia sp. TaxID=507699 RepID=UPI00260ADE15|nr:ankyrin repeat domain-containing protein [uncultured Kordia sp.]